MRGLLPIDNDGGVDGVVLDGFRIRASVEMHNR